MFTEEKWDELVRSEMDWAIAQKKRTTGDDEFLMRVRIVGPADHQIVDTPLSWTNEKAKHLAMKVASKVCNIVSAQAVVVVSDMRALDVTAFCKHFDIPEPTAWNDEQFEANRRRIMEPLGFYMGNLPRHTFIENLGVIVRGPRVCRMATVRYHVAEDKTIAFDPMDERKDGVVTINMIPAWWN